MSHSPSSSFKTSKEPRSTPHAFLVVYYLFYCTFEEPSVSKKCRSR